MMVLRLFRDAIGRERLRRRLLAGAPGVRIDRTVEVRWPERLSLGREVAVDRGVLLHCGNPDWSPPEAGIAIGAHSYIGPHAVLFGGAGIEIGEAVLISPGVVITSHQHTFAATDTDIRAQPLHFGVVRIERDVWVGANATILPGVRLGAGSIVGAGAVVTRDVPPRSIVLGIPAKVSHER